MATTSLSHSLDSDTPVRPVVACDDSTWQECLRTLEGRLPRHAFEICLRGSRARTLAPGRLEIVLGNGYALEMIRRRQTGDVEQAAREVLLEVTGEPWSLEWKPPSSPPTPTGTTPLLLPLASPASAPAMEVRLHRSHDNATPAGNPHGGALRSVSPPRQGSVPGRPSSVRTSAASHHGTGAVSSEGTNDGFTFDAFVVGPGNQMAAQAARQVADNPGCGFNPLVIYGEVGLGKTHLMKAVANHVRRVRPGARVVLASTEAFTNELVEAFENRRTGAFRRKYRQVDVLLVDDMEFLIGKERIQEEFYHTFEEVVTRGSQVILTCDRPPHLLTNLQGRLCSRLSSGLIADIQPPDHPTRMAILRLKARASGISLAEDVLRYVAEGFVGNVRQLEGALKRLQAYAQAQGQSAVDLALATRALDGMRTSPGDRLLTLPVILQKVAEYFQVQEADLVGSRRDRRISHPRHVAMFLATKLANCRCRELADAFGGKDYSTVIHAIRKIEGLQDDPTTRTDLRNLYAVLGREPRG